MSTRAWPTNWAVRWWRLAAAVAAGLGLSLAALAWVRSEAAALPPASTAGFVQAYGRADVGALERVASPLYFLEWARRGVSSVDQARLLEDHRRAPSGEWLFFAYATGFVDRGGFGHYLYVGRPVITAGSPSPSVWRVDTDSDGRVIWIEMVWLFSSRESAVRAIPPHPVRDDIRLWAILPGGPDDLLFGVASTTSAEGYYGVGRPIDGASLGTPSVQFYAVDDSGGLRLAGWTYGDRFPNRPLADRQALQADLASLLAAYLASIR